jgi:hypothetical protein
VNAATSSVDASERSGATTTLILGDVTVVLPGTAEDLRRLLLELVDDDTWAAARRGFGDPDLANQ